MRKNLSVLLPVIFSALLVLASLATSLIFPEQTLTSRAAPLQSSKQPTAVTLEGQRDLPPTETPTPRKFKLGEEVYEDEVTVSLLTNANWLRVGDIVTFQVVVKNVGDTRINKGRITLPIGEGFTILSARIGKGGDTDVNKSKRIVVGRFDRLKPGESTTLTVRAFVNRNAERATLSGQAKVNWDTGSQVSNRFRFRMRK